jgi:hypothetical protein
MKAVSPKKSQSRDLTTSQDQLENGNVREVIPKLKEKV